MLKIITGRAKSGKTNYIIENIKQNISVGKKSFLMVPEQMTLETEQMLTEKIDKPLFFAKIMSFDRFSQEVLSKSGGTRRKYIDDIGKIMMLESILKDIKPKLKLYKNTIEKFGFLETVEKTISEFKNQDISPQQLDEISENIKDKQLLSLKLKDISMIYDKLEESLKDKYIDTQSRLCLLCEKIEKYSKNFEYEMFFDNYIEFSNIEKQVIYTLLQNNIDVTIAIACDFDEHDNSFAISKNTFKDFIKMAQELCVKYEIIQMQELYYKNRELKHLQENIGSLFYSKYMDENSHLKVYSFDYPETEIEFIANKINNLVRHNEYRYKDIAVVLPEIENYSKIIKKTFLKYSIPYFVDEKRTVTKENIIRLIFAFLDMFVKSPNYKNIMSFFKTGMSDISKEEYEVFENYMIKWNMNKKPYIEEKYFIEQRYFEDIKEDEQEKIKKTYQYIYEIYTKYKKAFSKKSTAKIFSEKLNNFLNYINAKDKINNLIERLKKTKNYEICAEISQIWNILMQTLDKVDNVSQDLKIDIFEYKNMLYNGLNSQEIAIIPSTVDTVIIMDIKRSKSLGCRTMFMSGLNDTLLPIVQKVDVIFQEQDKKIMNENKLEIRNTSKNNFLRENALLYSIITRAEEDIIFTYPITDINSQSAGKSSYLIKIENIFPNIEKNYINIEDLKYEDNYRENMTLNAVFSNLIEELAKQVEENNFKEESLKLFKYFQQNPYFSEKCQKVKKSLFLENTVQNIDTKDIKKIYNLPLNVSVSQIQTYIACPFRHYMKYAIKPQKRQSLLIDNLQEGTIMHRFMEEFSKDILENEKIKSLNTKEKIRKYVEEIYQKEDFLDKNTKNIVENSKRQNHIVNRLRKISNKVTEFVVEQKSISSFITENTEYEIQPVAMKINDESDPNFNTVIVKGKVDRIDSIEKDNKKYIQIIDYKSSDKKIDIQDIINAIDIQLLFYAYAVTKEKNANIHAAFYMPMTDPIIKIKENEINKVEKKLSDISKMNSIITNNIELMKAFENDIQTESRFIDVKIKKDEVSGKNVFSEEEMKLLIKHILTVIKEASNEILNGKISPVPIKDFCEYCDYKNICRFDPTIKGFEYRKLPKLKKEEALEIINQSQESKENELD